MFLDGFSRAHSGWLVTVESVSRRGTPVVVFRDVPLVGVTDDDGRLIIATGIDNAHADRIVEHPIGLRVDRTAEGAERGLEIETAGGDLVRLRFRTAIATELVDGM
jgi:hypothetical protein